MILSFLLAIFLFITSATIVTNRFVLNSDSIIGSLRTTNFHDDIYEQIRNNLSDRIILEIPDEIIAYIESNEELAAHIGSIEELLAHIGSMEELLALIESNEELMAHIESNEELMAHIESNEELMAHIESNEELLAHIESNEELLAHIESNEELLAHIESNEELLAHIESNEELTAHIESNEELAAHVGLNEELAAHVESNEEMAAQIESNEELIAQIVSQFSDDLPTNSRMDLRESITYYINDHLLELGLTWAVESGIIADLVGEIIDNSDIDNHLLELGLTWAIENGVIAEIIDNYSDNFSSPSLDYIARFSNMFMSNLWRLVIIGLVGIIITMGIIYFVSRRFAFRYFAFGFGMAALMTIAGSLSLRIWGGNRILGVVPQFVYDLAVAHIERTILSFLLVGAIITLLYIIFIIIYVKSQRKPQQAQVAATP